MKEGRLAAVGCVMHLCNQPLDHQRLAILAAMPRLALDWLLRAYQKPFATYRDERLAAVGCRWTPAASP
jgi:hypothetical protein